MTGLQWLHLGLIVAYAGVIWLLWHTPVLYPFKLLTIYVHELGHALAGLATGAKIDGIEVHANEGGVCHLRGGNMWLILPAGYLGSAVFGSLLVLLGILSLKAALFAKVAAVLLIVALVVSLWWADSWLTRGIAVGFVALIGFLWWFQNGVGLRYLINFIGTMSALYAIYDIYDDTIRRSVPESDASLMAKKTGIPAIVWGLIWCAFSCGLRVGVVYLGVKLQG
jgi:hypothetical protein